MIYLYTGTPGSGKSLRAAYKIISKLKHGYNVIANFPIDMGYFGKSKIGKFLYLDNSELTVRYLKDFARKNHKFGKEGQTLIVIDECASMFNCRSWDAKGRMDWIYFMQQHRKLGFDMLLISQHDRLIDKQIRSFVETEYKHRAIKNYTLFGSLLSFMTGGLFVAVEYWYGTNLRVGKEMFRFNKKKAKIYDTNLLFE